MTEMNEVDVEYEAFMKALAGRLKELRKERGLSLHDMVVKHGYQESQWRRYERKGSVTIPSLIRIARAFGVSLSALLDGIGELPAAVRHRNIKVTAGSKECSPEHRPNGEEE